MKRILILLLVLSLVFCFVACKEEEPTTDPTPETTPAVDADLKAAYDLVHNLSKDITEATGANYDLVGSVKVKDKNYKVNWTVTVADNQVTLQTSEDGLTVTVVVPSNEPNADIPYTLKFTVTNEKGESLSREYSHYVPKFKVNTHEEYLNAKQDDPLVVEGIVVAMNSKSAGNSRNHLFLADATVTGGYYIYQMDVDPVTAGIQVGMTVRVTGPAAPYSGMQEIKGGVPEIIDPTIKNVPTVDITAAFAAGSDLKAYVGLPVTIKGVTIGDQELGGTSDYLKFSLNGKESYVRSYKTDLPTSFTDLAAAKAAIEAAHASHFNWSADVTGILVLFSGNPYLIPMTEDCFTFLQAQEMSDAEKVANSLNAITVPGKVTSDTTITLPAVGQNFADVVLSWTLEANDAATLDGTTLTLTVPESKTTVTLTVTATLGEVTETKTFTIELSKEATPVADVITEALKTPSNEFSTDKYLVAGVITEVYNTTYGNMKITDAYGNILTIYGTYSADGADRYDAMATKPVAGDYVVILGGIGNYNGTPQVKNGWIQSWTTPTSVEDAINIGAAQEDNVWTADKILVTGEITEIYNTTYGNMKIKDAAGNILTIYGTYDSNGKNRFDAMTSQPKVGDTVTIYGVPGRYGNTKQIKNGWIMQVVAGTPAPSCEHTNTETATTDATCTVAGSTTVTCTDCGEVVSTTEIPAPGHTMSAATCVAPATCSVCGHTEGEAAGHTFVEGTCSVCGTTETHECNFVAGETVAPTCTEAGYTVYNCTCGATENRDEVAATGHEEVEETDPATCTTAGAVKVVCANCETVISSTPTEKLPHTDATGDYKCDACSAVVEPADGTALTIAEALKLAKVAGTNYTTNKYYVTGRILSVANTQYGNMTIVDENGDELYLYGLYSADGKTRYDAMATKPVAGDEITVYTVLGVYGTTAQGKNAWLDELVVHEHTYDDVVTDPTCTAAGYTTHTCSGCGDTVVDTTVAALGHTTEDGVCERCGETISSTTPTEPQVLATFEFGSNGSASHVDGNDMPATQKYTDGAYTLSFDSVTKVYSGARDAKGNSCLKFGTSKLVGSLSFTVGEDVDEVVIYVAKYKSNGTTISVNGTNYTLTKNSNDGEYDVIRIDTSVNKTVTIATVASTYRCMINTIEFVG